ncbi:MAG: hypothetical protein SGJ24_03900 [Chloroflexota bacterium]|nr:hypothetical protein [Chloroflexota bacterium]
MHPPLTRTAPEIDSSADRFARLAHTIDGHLPGWARRSNPIVRRHLGTSWKTFTPNFRLLLRIVGLQAAIVVVSFVFPVLFEILMPTVTVALVLLPGGVLLYAQILFRVGTASSAYWADERRNDTLALTLMIPQPARQTIYAKMAASLWRHLENLMGLAVGAALLSLPLLVVLYDMQFSIDAQPLLFRVGVLTGLAASVARLWLEPVMVAAFGALFGVLNSARTPAATATLITTGAYFLIVTLLRAIPQGPIARMATETLLPVLAPIALTAGAIWLTERVLRRL